MKTQLSPLDSKTVFAAQNAREGLINVLDLSLLTGAPVAQLTGLAKKGFLNSYAEYHGKRFFKFEEVLGWAMADGDDEARRFLSTAVNELLKHPECPYSLERVTEEGEARIRLSWKEAEKEAA
jgi:hypothetical protein